MKKAEVISQLHVHACKRLTELREDRTILWIGESDEISQLTYISCHAKGLYISDNLTRVDVPYSKIKKIATGATTRKWLYLYLSDNDYDFKITLRLTE